VSYLPGIPTLPNGLTESTQATDESGPDPIVDWLEVTFDSIRQIAEEIIDSRSPEVSVPARLTALVAKSLFNAQTILAAITDNDPVPITVGEQTLLGRITGGDVTSLTPAQVRTLLDISAFSATLLNDADAATARSTLGIGAGYDAYANAYAGIVVPPRSLDGFAAGFVRADSTLNGALDASQTNVTITHAALLRTSLKQVIRVDNEEMHVTAGMGTTSLTVIRGMSGTTAATHASGAVVYVSLVRHVLIMGDSIAQGTIGGLDTASQRMRRLLSSLLGGELGLGFRGIYRDGGVSYGLNSSLEWVLTGTWFTAGSGPFSYVSYDLMPRITISLSSGTGNYATWTRPKAERVRQIDVVFFHLSTGVGNGWSYSLDSGTTWVNNPMIADAAPAANMVKKARIVVRDMTSIRIRAADKDGTGETTYLLGISAWNQVEDFGRTTGMMIHNLGVDGYTLAQSVRANAVFDAVTNGTTTVTSAHAAFVSGDTGKVVRGTNIPAGSTMTYVSATAITIAPSAATGSATGGTLWVQGTTGDWAAWFDGHPASILPDLVLNGVWSNDADLGINGYRSVTGDITSTTTLTLTAGTFTSADTGLRVTGVGIPWATTLTYVSATVATLSQASTNGTGIACRVYDTQQQAGGNVECFGYALDTFNTRLSYADHLHYACYEQGGTRHVGSTNPTSTDAVQQLFRTKIAERAAAYSKASLDYYEAWKAVGNTGYDDSLADGLMLDTLHPTALGYRDMAARPVRLLTTLGPVGGDASSDLEPAEILAYQGIGPPIAATTSYTSLLTAPFTVPAGRLTIGDEIILEFTIHYNNASGSASYMAVQVLYGGVALLDLTPSNTANATERITRIEVHGVVVSSTLIVWTMQGYIGPAGASGAPALGAPQHHLSGYLSDAGQNIAALATVDFKGRNFDLDATQTMTLRSALIRHIAKQA
jgi:hypothetical protein